jgi:hypothetical protein
MSDSKFANEKGSVPMAAESSNQPRTAEQKAERTAANNKLMAEHKERNRLALEAEAAKPWFQQSHWRRSTMYKNWAKEDILEQAGEFAAITQSPYGFQVLTARDLGFIDVDFDADFFEPWMGGWTWQPADVLTNLKGWVATRPDESYKVYQTAGGNRIMRTDRAQPIDQNYKTLSELLGADPIYLRVCSDEQRSFRPRLSPKPSRVGIKWPMWDFYGHGMWDGDGSGADGYRGYSFTPPVQEYKTAAAKYATCKLVTTIGSGVIDDALLPLVTLHDARCNVFADVPLEPFREYLGPTWLQLVEIHEACYNYAEYGLHADLIWDLMGEHDQAAQQALRSLSPEKCQQVRADAAHAAARRAAWLKAAWGPAIDDTNDGRYWKLELYVEGSPYPEGSGSAIIRFLPGHPSYIECARASYISNILGACPSNARRA